MLLKEYARSVARDGAACNAQVCGNAVLRQHVATDLRQAGPTGEAAEMEAAFHRTLDHKPPEAPHKTSQTPEPRLNEWQKLNIPMVVWAKQVPLVLRSVPWWVWVALSSVYMAIAGILVSFRRKERTAITILGGEENLPY